MNYKFLIIVGLIALVIVLGFGNTGSLETPALEKASSSVISDSPCSITYSFDYSRQDTRITSCSDYDFSYSTNMPSSQLTKPSEGIKLNTWTYGKVTNDFTVDGIINYQSGVERRDSNSAFINNSKVQCKIDNSGVLTCRFTGQCNIREGISAPYGFAVIAGTSGSAEVTFVKDIPSCQQEVKQEEVVQQQIEQQSQNSIMKLSFIDRINLMFQKFIDWLKGGFK